MSELIDPAIRYSEAYFTDIHIYQMPFYTFQYYHNLTAYPDLRLQNSDQVVGISLNGVLLFTGTSEYGYDAFFPKAYGNMKNPQAVLVDVCLGSAHTYNTYRYQMFSPCIYEVPLRSISAPCQNSGYAKCAQDIK